MTAEIRTVGLSWRIVSLGLLLAALACWTNRLFTFQEAIGDRLSTYISRNEARVVGAFWVVAMLVTVSMATIGLTSCPAGE